MGNNGEDWPGRDKVKSEGKGRACGGHGVMFSRLHLYISTYMIVDASEVIHDVED